MSAPDPEQDLAQAAARGDQEAFAALVERHQSVLFNLARYMTGKDALAEECVQDSLLRAWERFGRFEYQGEGSLRGWLLRLTSNACLDALRKQRSEAHQMKRIQERNAARERDARTARDAEAERAEQIASLRSQLDQLAQEDRLLVALYYGAEMTQTAIAETLDIPQQTISSRIQRVLARLRGALTEAGAAAALPLLAEQGLREAVTTGAAAPPSLGAVLKSKLATAARATARRSARWAGAAGPKAALLCAAAVGLAAAGAFVWQQQAPGARVEPEAPPSADPAPQVVYESDFTISSLPEFWAKVEPLKSENLLSYGFSGGQLSLLAAGSKEQNTAFVLLGGKKVDVRPAVSVASKPVALAGGALEIRVAIGRYHVEGSAEAGVEVRDEQDLVLASFVLRGGSRGIGDHQEIPLEGAWTLGERSSQAQAAELRLRVTADGRIARLDGEGREAESVQAAAQSVSLRLWARSQGATSQVRMDFAKIRVERAAAHP
ncbi:MAG: sigma-70 family RNA polymerase sigma factor [Planctomycetes bacterium]|nr:sigma-70 family RNA polymerase sigma factor [Planctomycetota bacterium]